MLANKEQQAEMANKSLLKKYFVPLFSLSKITLNKAGPGCTNFSLFPALLIERPRSNDDDTVTPQPFRQDFGHLLPVRFAK